MIFFSEAEKSSFNPWDGVIFEMWWTVEIAFLLSPTIISDKKLKTWEGKYEYIDDGFKTFFDTKILDTTA
jgi:hypothetical protein